MEYSGSMREQPWLEHGVCQHRVIGSNPEKVDGGDQKGIELLSTDQVFLLTRAQTPRSRTGINNIEYKPDGPTQKLLMRNINSTAPGAQEVLIWSINRKKIVQ